VIATFFEVFPHGSVWTNDVDGKGYDAILFGQAEPTVINLDEFQRRLGRADHRAVKESLQEVGFGAGGRRTSPRPEEWAVTLDLLATYAGQAPLMQDWSRGAQINTDRNLRLQYLAGMWLNSNLGGEILSSILAHYRFPDRMFVGSPERVRALRAALEAAGRK
jgi:spermidine synthase